MVLRKYVASGTLVLLLAGGGAFYSLGQVHAEDTASSDRQTVTSTNDDQDSHMGGVNEQEQLDNESQQIDEMDQEEDNVHNQITTIDTAPAPELPEVTPADLVTYGDVVTALGVYSQALDTVASQANVTSTVDNSLTQQEIDLFNSIVSKHARPFAQLAVRVKEIRDQLQAVSDLLTPLSSASVAPVLKKPLVTALNNFRDEINNLHDFEHASFDILNFETSN